MIDWVRSQTHRGLCLLSGIQHRARRRFTPMGLATIGLMVAGGVFGADTRQNLAHQIFALAFALLLVSWLLTLRLGGRFRARRRLPPYATVGEPLPYRIEVEKLAGRSSQGLEIVEESPDPRPSRQEFLDLPAPDEQEVNAFDRLMGYPRWRWQVSNRRPMAEPRAIPLPRLEAKRTAEVEARLIPLRRGYLRLDHLLVRRTDPLGLSRAWRRIAMHQRILVMPRRYRVPHLELPGNRRYQPGGVSLASRVGEAQEFVGLRDYRPGDSLRHIHWAGWARSGQPVVKEYQDEFFTRHALILDTFVEPGWEARFEEAVSLAASFVEPLQAQDALLDLLFVGRKAYRFTGGRGLMSVRHMLEVLACAEACRNTPFSTLSEAVAAQGGELSAALCILLAWDKARRDLVERLQMLGLPLRVLVVAPEEAVTAPDPRHAAGFVRLVPGRIEEGLASL